jgi:hypothetical protein
MTENREILAARDRDERHATRLRDAHGERGRRREEPLYVKATAVSSGMTRMPAARRLACEAMRGRDTSGGGRLDKSIMLAQSAQIGMISDLLRGNLAIVSALTFKC